MTIFKAKLQKKIKQNCKNFPVKTVANQLFGDIKLSGISTTPKVLDSIMD